MKSFRATKRHVEELSNAINIDTLSEVSFQRIVSEIDQLALLAAIEIDLEFRKFPDACCTIWRYFARTGKIDQAIEAFKSCFEGKGYLDQELDKVSLISLTDLLSIYEKTADQKQRIEKLIKQYEQVYDCEFLRP